MEDSTMDVEPGVHLYCMKQNEPQGEAIQMD